MNKIYIVGTPIGNLEDITIRALNTLREAEVIACEDTRVTRRLLDRYEIKDKRLITYNDVNEKHSAEGLVKLWNEGAKIAVVSDAGMPVVNDPGFIIVRNCIKNGIPFEVIPGPSAVLTALVLSNFDTHFKFQGFFKPKTGQRQNQISSLEPGTHIFFASPHKLIKTIQDISLVLPTDKIYLGKELTKFYETSYRGTANEVLEQLPESIKGEYTLLIEVSKKKVNKYAKK